MNVFDARGHLSASKCVTLGRLSKIGCSDSKNMSRGSYHIYLDRTLSAAVELHHDADGMALPPSIAPFDVVITPVSIADAALRSASEEISEACRKMGLDALLDDRDERPGVKFKDADLVGIPYRITIGKKLAEGVVEVVERRTKRREEVGKEDAAALVAKKVRL
jgi:prolyl-tRNA synthetase